MEVFMASMDGVLSNLFYREMSLPMTNGLELDDVYGSF